MSTSFDAYGALEGFFHSVALNPDAPAVHTAAGTITYGALEVRARRVAAHIAREMRGERGFVGILAQRDPVLYEGVIGTLLAGSAYVPINPRNPPARIREILSLAGCRVLIAQRKHLQRLQELPEQVVTIIVPDGSGDDLAVLAPRTVLGADALEQAGAFEGPTLAPADPMYLIFTSGTTGVPKGIVIRHRNVRHYIGVVSSAYGYAAGDRVSQAFDASFDVSVHDMFMAWQGAACLCPPADADLLAPGRFILRNQLTVWYTVPSVGLYMKRLGMLKENSYPSLRYCITAGEALSDELADAWRRAAPHARILNLYGPTEATVSITSHECTVSHSAPDGAHRAQVPIGKVFPGHHVILLPVDAADSVTRGELCIAGPQIFDGYYGAGEGGRACFHRAPDGRDYYRTGDLVDMDPDGTIHFIGRIDHQVKIRGYRVELQELEDLAMRTVSTDFAVAVAYRSGSDLDDDIALIHGCADIDAGERLARTFRSTVPEYMIPKRFIPMEQLPVTPHGKTDRKALRHLLESGGFDAGV
jgi:amino acid adenylation domain-containing protein